MKEKKEINKMFCLKTSENYRNKKILSKWNILLSFQETIPNLILI